MATVPTGPRWDFSRSVWGGRTLKILKGRIFLSFYLATFIPASKGPRWAPKEPF